MTSTDRIDPTTRLKITHDPIQKTLLVTHLQHHAWLLFPYVNRLAAIAMAANIKYLPDITGAPNPDYTDISAAWKLAQDADLSTIPVAVHKPPRSRITPRVARVLAAKYRIAEFGGVMGDQEAVDRLHELDLAEQAAIARRQRGLVVL